MKRILIPLFATAVLASSMVALSSAGTPRVHANPDGALTHNSFAAAGRYGIVADGIGLNGKDDDTDAALRTIQLDVPGSSVVAAHLYWAGYHNSQDDSTLNSVSVSVDDDPTPDTVIADETYGPDEWAGSYYHFVFVSDVTSLVQSGSHSYTISGAGLTFMENYGAGLMVVYEDAGLPLSYVVINDGLDSLHCEYETPQGPDSEITYFDFAAEAGDRGVDITLFAGGVENDSRPNSLWYQTGSGTKPSNLVDEAGATELSDAPPPYPLVANNGVWWDTYINSDGITVPAGDSWLGLQIESVADVPGETCCEALFVAAGLVIPSDSGVYPDGIPPSGDSEIETTSEIQALQSGSAAIALQSTGGAGCQADIVFIVDTSGSMCDEWNDLCSILDTVISDLSAEGYDVVPHVVALDIYPSLGDYCYGSQCSWVNDDCIDTVWNAPSVSRGECSTSSDCLMGYRCYSGREQWGPGVEYWSVSNSDHVWRDCTTRIIIPISDEGPYGGCPVDSYDWASIADAATAANANNVVVCPMLGDTPASQCSGTGVWDTMTELAGETGGQAFDIDDATDLANAIKAIVEENCGVAIHKVGPSEICSDEDYIDYTITVRNNFPELVTGLEVKDTLDANVDYVSSSGGDGSAYDSGTHTVTWTIASLDSGAQVELQLTVAVNDPVPELIINRAEVVTYSGVCPEVTPKPQVEVETTRNDCTRPIATAPDVTLCQGYSQQDLEAAVAAAGGGCSCGEGECACTTTSITDNHDGTYTVTCTNVCCTAEAVGNILPCTASKEFTLTITGCEPAGVSGYEVTLDGDTQAMTEGSPGVYSYTFTNLVPGYYDWQVDATGYLGANPLASGTQEAIYTGENYNTPSYDWPCVPPPPSSPPGGSTPGCSFEFDMLGEIVEIDVDCCNNSVFSTHLIYDPDEENFVSIDRGTPVICGDCVGCGSYPMLVKITEAEDDFPPAPEGTEIIAVYNCEGFKGKKICSHVTFGKPIVLLLRYDPDALDEDVSSVFIARYNPELGVWEPLPFPGGVAGAGEGEVRALTSSFSMFAVIAELKSAAPPEPPPTTTPEPPAPEPEPPAAHFVIGDLSIIPSGKFIGIGNIAFMVEKGKNVTVSADISNDGGQSGNYSASLIINGETASSREITLGPGQGQEVTFTLSGNEPGHYIIQMDNQRGEFTVVRWTNWPFIAGLATAFGFLVWAVWYLVYRRRRRLESEG